MKVIRERLLLTAAVLMALAAFSNNYLFLVAISVVCFGISLYLIYRLISNKQANRFFLLSSLACGAWTTGGFLQSAYYLLGQSRLKFSSLFAESEVVVDVKDYAISFAYVFLFILLAAFISRLPFILKAEKLFSYYVLGRLRAIGLATWSLILLAFSVALASASFMGLISIRGLSEEFYSDRGILPWWYVVLTFMVSMLPLLVSQVFIRLKTAFSLPAIIGVFGLIMGLYYNSLFGRFSLLSFVILIPFCWIAIQNPSLSFTPKQFFGILAFILILFIMLPLLSSLLAFINVVRYDRGFYTNPILFIASYLEFASSSDSVSIAIGKSAENLSSRPLVLWPLAASMKMAFEGLNSDYLYFGDLLNSALNSLPRFLFPVKENLLLQEELLYSQFPFANVDTADSPYLYAFASFGIFGAFVYPLAIALVYWLFLGLTIYASKNGFWFPACLASTSALISFSIISYGELATTGLFRQFLIPASVSLVALSAGFIRTSRRKQLQD